jgi:hypothetical protein
MHLCICNMYSQLTSIFCLKCVLIFHTITCLYACPRVMGSVFRSFSSFLIFTTFIVSMIASVVHYSEFLATDPEVRVRFPALPDFLRSSGSGTGSPQPREYN